MLAGLDAVTAEDVQRVAQDVVGEQLKLAVIGPFEDRRAVREPARARLTERPASMTDERALLVRTAEIAARYLDTLDTRPVRPEADYGAMLAAIDRPVPEDGLEPMAVVEELAAARRARAHRDGIGTLLRLRHRRHAAVVARGRLARLDLGPEHGPRAGDARHLGARGRDRTLGARAPRACRRTPRSPSSPAARWRTSRRSPPPGTPSTSASATTSRERGLAGAPPLRVVVGAKRHVTLTRALRLLGIGQRAGARRPRRRPGPDARRAARGRARGRRHADDRLRPGGRGEHRRRRRPRDGGRRRARPRTRGSTSTEPSASGPQRARASRTSSAATPAPTRGRPTPTSG